MWIMARYLPVAPFSLKPANSTSSGGKTLLAPTPYALKMALLDAALRTLGLAEGERLFPFIRDLAIAIDLPHDLVVMKSFSKIRRPVESKDSQKKDETREDFEMRVREKEATRLELKQYPFYSTIAYREYVYYRDPFSLAFAVPNEPELQAALVYLLARINYVGKRGGFIQLLEAPKKSEDLAEGPFVALAETEQRAFYQNGTLQILDDCAQSLSFQRANIYSAERVTLLKERVLRHVVLPYQLQSSSRSYSWYQRIAEEG
jgi:hypothetical protein